jgi:membrane peptidoglycan carboxypeptidase
MEMILPKERILEIYLPGPNGAKGAFGFEARSGMFNGKSAARLTTDQAARLLALLSSPTRYTPATLPKSGILRSRYSIWSASTEGVRDRRKGYPLPSRLSKGAPRRV